MAKKQLGKLCGNGLLEKTNCFLKYNTEVISVIDKIKFLNRYPIGIIPESFGLN